MKRQLRRMWTETDGVLSFEWTLLLTLLTIGIVSGLAGARDAIIDELGDVAEAAQAFNQSYSYTAVTFSVDGNNDGDTTDPEDFTFTAAGSAYTEGPEDSVYTDCTRGAGPNQVGPGSMNDDDS